MLVNTIGFLKTIMVFPTTKNYKKVVGAPHFPSIHHPILTLSKSLMRLLAIFNILKKRPLELGATHLGSCSTQILTI